MAPWQDFKGNNINEGDTIQHPSGERGVVVFLADEAVPSDQWRVDYGTGELSRLCLQIGKKGRAVVIPTITSMMRECKECGMLVEPGEYHPYAACLMFKSCGDGLVVRANLVAVLAEGYERASEIQEAISEGSDG